ncbi:MAG: Tat proofreading chaperone DmsD [Anaerolineales bacterium]|jgi:TorA maturation chaperone TorD|nr:Tat proofreading chaperone DmsD [Anaerolineales bacterium]
MSQMMEWSSFLVGESLLCGLLGKILYEEPDQAWLETLIREDVFAETPLGADQAETQRGLELLQRWANENRNGISETEMKALKQDHLNLFIGVDKVLAPLWESVYFSEKKLVFQEQTLQVREWYSRFQLQAERINREPDDHIGLELIFIAHLASRALQAIEENDEAAFNELLQAQRDFLSEHLLCWGPSWAKLVKRHAQTDFYRGIGHLVHGSLLALADGLEIVMPKEVAL